MENLNSSFSFVSDNGIFITHFDILGYIAIILSLIAFLVKDVQKMRIYGGLSTLLFGINVYFYNGINGLFVCLISFLSKVLTYYIKDEKIINVIKYSLPVMAFIFYFNFNNEGSIIALLPTISLIFIVLADIQKDILKMKMWYFGSAFCWLFYGISINSIPAILFDILGILTLFYSVFEILKERHILHLKAKEEELENYCNNLNQIYENAIKNKDNIKKLDSKSSHYIYTLGVIKRQINELNNMNPIRSVIYIKNSQSIYIWNYFKN